MTKSLEIQGGETPGSLHLDVATRGRNLRKTRFVEAGPKAYRKCARIVPRVYQSPKLGKVLKFTGLPPTRGRADFRRLADIIESDAALRVRRP